MNKKGFLQTRFPTPWVRFFVIAFGISVGVLVLMVALLLILGPSVPRVSKNESPVVPDNASIYGVSNFSRKHFCEVEATILTKNISLFSSGVNLEMISPYERFYHKAKLVFERFEEHKYRGYSKLGEKAWPSIEAKADSGILNFTLGALKKSQNGSVNALLLYTLIERTNLILSMDKSYCGSPSWWPKQYPTSTEGIKKIFQKGG